VVGNENDAEIRAALIAAARAQIGREDSSHFNIRGLCEEAGISKAEFRRFFPGREALIAAVLNEDVAHLHEIAEANAEPRVTLAVANGAPVSAPAPASAPLPDAWLERRLRVFERALAGLESRQEKTEQLLSRSVALLEEKIARPVEKPVLQVAPPTAPPEPLPEAPPAKAEAAAPVAKMTPLPALELDLEPPVTPKEMEDLLANARRVAREAALVEPPAPKPKRVPRWMAWTAVGCIAMMALTALIIANIAGASSARGDGISHRQTAQKSLAQIAALASRGDLRSQTMLALASLNGQHGSSDPATALRWGLAAAKQGVPLAQYLVGTLYQDGSGVAPDPHQAFGWFEAAALRGNVKAMHDLAIAYAEGQGTAHDAARAAAWFNRAAGQGYVDSQFDLAVLYERGDGVRQNPQAALKWYLIAANAGDVQSRSRAGQLASEMKPADVARAKALAAEFTPAERDPAANTL
jgi:AcrR family transcriptional regulator